MGENRGGSRSRCVNATASNTKEGRYKSCETSENSCLKIQVLSVAFSIV